ncbi:hypothetical protein PWR66_19600 [Paraburkholderia sp. A1RO-5]|uniref:hypothetical protein n=1 Tax=Paraburkholderia sp. A1RO-5 TaxID=3028369 RepID=UPI003B7C3EC9
MGTLKHRGRLVPASALLIAGAYAVSAGAQIARPVGTQYSQPTAPMAAPTPSAPAAPTAPPPTTTTAAARTNTPATPQQMLYYVCGNMNIDGHVTSPDPQHPFNLGVSFISSGNTPLTEVSVKVRRHGRVLMDFVAAGPHCLFSVPDADYRIEGTYRGETKFEIVQTGTMNAQIKW